MTPMTELEAVNAILWTIGESPVSTLEDLGSVDAEAALSCLRRKSREIQARGWYFNTDDDLMLPLSSPDRFIIVPANTLSADAAKSEYSVDAVLRGNRLYDRRRHTFVFENPVRVDIVSLLPFEDLPQSARDFIAIAAGRQFQAGAVGSPILHQLTEVDEARVRATLMNEEARSADYNMLSGSWSVAGVLAR